MAKITNLKEFFESRGFGMDAGEMYSYGRALYKYTFGPWITYLVEDEPTRVIEFKIEVRSGPKGEATFAHDHLPERVLSFFNLNTGEVFMFEEYVDLVSDYAEKHTTTWEYDYSKNHMLLVITGTHEIPATEREVYYDSKEARSDTLKLADKVIGIRVGSIIEGADYDAEPFELLFPFDSDSFGTKLDELGEEVNAEWRKVNCTYYSVRRADGDGGILYCQWVSGDNAPEWADGDIDPEGIGDELDNETLAILAGNALIEADDRSEKRIPVPGAEAYVVQEDEQPSDF